MAGSQPARVVFAGGDGEAGDGVVVAVDYYFVAADFADAAFNDFARHCDRCSHCQPIEVGTVRRRGLHGDRERVAVVFDRHLVMERVRDRFAPIWLPGNVTSSIAAFPRSDRNRQNIALNYRSFL